MKLIHCQFEPHGPPILEILNHEILTSTALYDYHPRSLRSMETWFANKQDHGFPILGATNAEGRLLGFATYGTFRAWPAYKYTVEHSVYVHPDFRGQGVGSQLLATLIEAAAEQQLHTLIGVIDSQNQASLALHQRWGFEAAGCIRQAGFKFGQWLDIVFMQKLLTTPREPQDG